MEAPCLLGYYSLLIPKGTKKKEQMFPLALPPHLFILTLLNLTVFLYKLPIVEDSVSRLRWDFRGCGKQLAFRGAGGEPPRASLCGVSPVPLIPQESRRFPPPLFHAGFSKPLLA